MKLECEEPSPEMKEIARKELRETPEIVEAAKQELRDLLKGIYFKISIKSFSFDTVLFLNPRKFYIVLFDENILGKEKKKDLGWDISCSSSIFRLFDDCC